MAANSILAKMAVEISANTAQFNAALKQTNAQLSSFQTSVVSAGKLVGGYFAAGQIFTGLKEGLQLITEFEYKMSTLQAISGATGAEMKVLRDDALALGSATQFAAKEVGGLQVEFSRLGFSTTEIRQATKATIDLATATGEDLAKSTFILGSSVRAFNLPASESAHLADVMTGAFNKTALQLEDFGEAMKYVGPVAAAANIKFEEASAVLGILADNNIRGSQAGTAFRRIIVDLTKDGSPLVDRLGELAAKGITVQNSFDDVGRIAQTALLVLEKGRERIRPLTEEFANIHGEAERVSNIMRDNLQGDFEKLTGAFKTATIEGGSWIGVFLRPATEKLTDFFNALTSDKISTLEKFLLVTGGASDVLANRQAQLVKQDTDITALARRKFLIYAQGYKNTSEAAQQFIKEQYALTDAARDENEQIKQSFRANEEFAIQKQKEFNGELAARRLLIKIAEEYIRATAPETDKGDPTKRLIIGTTALGEEIKRLKELQGSPLGSNHTIWQQYEDQINHLELEIVKLETGVQRFKELGSASINPELDLSKVNNQFSDLGLASSVKYLKELQKGAKDAGDAFTSMTTRMSTANYQVIRFNKETGQSFINWAQLVKDVATKAIVGFGDAIGAALGGDKKVDVGKKFLQGLISFLHQFGELLVAAGVAALGLDALLKEGGPVAAGAAIAAGVALIALTSAAATKLNNSARGNDSSTTAGGRAGSGGGFTVQVVGTSIVRGQDIYISYSNYSGNKNG
jgi:hypothetical protein